MVRHQTMQMSERLYITCRQLIDFLADYLSGDIDDLSRHELERHLGRCRSCQAYLDSYRTTTELLGELDEPATDVPEELVSAILARTRDMKFLQAATLRG